MQLVSLSIYSHDGKQRDVNFRLGKLNIITGDSKTGKSALLNIVDYCLGRKSSSIPQGEQFAKISWYALVVQFEDGRRAIVAREAPKPGKTNTVAMLEFGGPTLHAPAFSDLRINTNTDALRSQLGARVGLSDVVVERNEQSTRGPVTIGLGTAVPLSLQEQHEIDSKSILFHRQNDHGVATGLRDGLPFFLGAVDGQQAAKRAQLRDARTQLRRIEARLTSIETEKQDWAQELYELLAEARSVHLIDDHPDDAEPLELLNRIRFTRTHAVPPADVDVRNQDVRRANEERRFELSQQLSAAMSHRDLLLDERDSEGGYDNSLEVQAGRLAILNLLPEPAHDDSETCPVCSQVLSRPDPTVGQMNERLSALHDELAAVSTYRGRRQRAVAEIDETIQQLRKQLNVVDAALRVPAGVGVTDSLEASQEFVRGRIDATLTRLRVFDGEGLARLKREHATVEATVNALEAELSGGTAREQLTSRLNALSTYLSKYSHKLDLEHAGLPIRLDIDQLTIVIDSSSGPLPLENIGSGENWVGYHIVAHLALHDFFIEQSRPVPRFLMIDQPSKAHFQSDNPLDRDDPDRETVQNMFKLFAEYAAGHNGDFQLIVIDHANYQQQWFQDEVVYNWRKGDALIPAHWTMLGARPGAK